MDNTAFAPALWRLDPEQKKGEGILGNASFDEMGGATLDIPMGTLLQEPIIEGVRTHAGPLRADAVYGYTQTGDNLTLVEVSTMGSSYAFPGTSRQQLDAHYAFSCRKKVIKPNPSIKSIQLTIDGLWRWSGLHNGSITEKLRESEHSIVGEWKSSDLTKITIYGDNAIKVSLIPTYTQKGGLCPFQEFSIRADASLLIEMLQGPIPLDSAMEQYAFPLWNFLSFCMGFRGDLKQIQLIDDGGNTVKYFMPLMKGVTNPSNKIIQTMPLPLRAIDSNTLIRNWLTMPADTRRASSIIISLMDNELMKMLDARFTNIASAFDALSRVGGPKIGIGKEDHAEIIRCVECALSHKPDLQEWALGRLQGNYPRASELAKSLFDRLAAFSAYVVPDRDRFLGDLRYNRNAYVHQASKLKNGKRALSGLDLYVHTQALYTICYGAIMYQLGLAPENILDHFKKSTYLDEYIHAARKKYGLTELP